jgi:hypothetical protein
MLQFDSAGNLLGVEQHPFVDHIPNYQSLYIEDALQAEWDAIVEWLETLGFSEETIAVKRFRVDGVDIRLELNDLPEYLREILDRGEEMNKGDREYLNYWHENQFHELYCGNGYDLNREGEVVSS